MHLINYTLESIKHMWLVVSILDGADKGHFHHCRKFYEKALSRDWASCKLIGICKYSNIWKKIIQT